MGVIFFNFYVENRGNYAFLQCIIYFPPILSQIGLIFPSYPRISPLLRKTRLTDDASSDASYDALRYGPSGGGGKLIHTPVKYIPLIWCAADGAHPTFL